MSDTVRLFWIAWISRIKKRVTAYSRETWIGVQSEGLWLLQLASLASLLPRAGSNGLLWLSRWQFNTTGDGGEESYRIFYVGANSTAGGSPTFFAGTGASAAPTTGIPPGDGCVTTPPQNCKIIVYPNEKVEMGTINMLTGIITITVP